MNTMYFAEHNSAEYGIIVTAMPNIPIAEERGEWIDVPSRNGNLFLSENVFASVTIPVTLWIPSSATVSVVTKWLTGSGNLRFSGWNWFWKAHVLSETALVPCAMNDGWNVTVQMRCEPFRYHYPEISTISITASPATLNNIGTASSQPRITVTGSGNITLTVNGTLMEFTGVSTGVVIDSEKMDVFAADGTTLANNIASMDSFPILTVGANAISYTGSVTSVSVLPRWRDI